MTQLRLLQSNVHKALNAMDLEMNKFLLKITAVEHCDLQTVVS